MDFEDLQKGSSVNDAIDAFLDGCNKRDTLFAPEGWRKPYITALRQLLSDPITNDQVIALRSAALKYCPLDTVIWWLRESPESPWEEYVNGRGKSRRRIDEDDHAFDNAALAKGLVTTLGAMGSVLACIVVGTVPLLYGKNSLLTGTQILFLAGIVATAVVIYFVLVFSNRRRSRTTDFGSERGVMSKATEKLLAFGFGVVFVVTLLVLAIAFPNPTSFQYMVFRIVLALAAGGIAAMIPGFIEVTLSGWLRAGGALAVFVVVYFYNPAFIIASNIK